MSEHLGAKGGIFVAKVFEKMGIYHVEIENIYIVIETPLMTVSEGKEHGESSCLSNAIPEC